MAKEDAKKKGIRIYSATPHQTNTKGRMYVDYVNKAQTRPKSPTKTLTAKNPQASAASNARRVDTQSRTPVRPKTAVVSARRAANKSIQPIRQNILPETKSSKDLQIKADAQSPQRR